jgi:hypothetical protein
MPDPDPDYIFMKGVVKRLEMEAARIDERLTAARAFVASYENGEGRMKDDPKEEPKGTPPKPANGKPELHFPQVAGGRRIRPGTFKYLVIRGTFDFLVSKWPTRKLHKREIMAHLVEKGVLDGMTDPMGRFSVILSQAGGVLKSDGNGHWALDPVLLPAEYREQEKEDRPQ